MSGDGRKAPGRVLIVAGSDSGGGAGIQADVKTATALGAYAMTAVTAITVQDTTGVHAVHPLPPELTAHQMRICLRDIGADAIKTGMLHDAATIEAVARVLAEDAKGAPLVLDPVMVAKGGARLVDETAVAALKRELMPRAAILTPNLPEAEALAGGRRIETLHDMREAAQALLTLGPQAVLLKGGHRAGPVVEDVLATADSFEVMVGPRIDTVHTHGTGCTLASAIASGLSSGIPLVDAVRRARAYVLEAIRTAPGLGRGHGPLNHMHTVRTWT